MLRWVDCGLILHFDDICSNEIDSDDTLDRPHVTCMTFFGCLKMDDVTFNPYDDCRQTHLFNDTCWYFGRIKCGHKMIYCYLSECVMR